MDYRRIDSLDYDKSMFIFGEPVLTQFGVIRHLTYREYLTNLPQLSLITQNTLHLYYQFKNIYKNTKDEAINQALNEIREASLYEVVLSMKEILEAYIRVIQLVLDMNEKIDVELIFSSKENFMFFRQLVMDMNVLTEDEVSPNEEIQKAIERSKRVKQKGKETQSFVDIVTSIVASTSNSFEDVCNMTVFQVYAIYARIGAIFNYQTSTLFATVAEKVKIESWNKHIDLFSQESDVLTKDEFDNKFGSILGKN